MRRLITALAVAFALMAPSARADEATHAAINKIYGDMSAAYRALDLTGLEKVYAADATYLQPGPQGTAGLVGRAAVVGTFKGFFDDARAKGDRLEIGFRIVNRTLLNPTTAVDLGHFLLTVTPKGGQPQIMAGTFVTVPTRQADGTWAFAADSYGPTSVQTYRTAAPVAGLAHDK